MREDGVGESWTWTKDEAELRADDAAVAIVLDGEDEGKSDVREVC